MGTESEKTGGPLGHLVDVVENIQKGFKEFRDVNDRMLAEEKAGNAARVNELQEVLERINNELNQNQKIKETLEKRMAMQGDRLEILESLNDRPRATVADKIKSEHKDLFTRWVRSKGTDQGAVDEYNKLRIKSREVKDVSLTDAAGGFALPEEISRSIDKMILAQSGILANVKNVQVGTSDYKELLNVNGTTYTWAAETDARSGTTEPTLRQIVPLWGELYAYMKASNWSIEDLFFNVEQWLVENAAEAFAVGLSTAIFSGNHVGKPQGMTHTAPTAVNDDGSGISPEAKRAQDAYQYIPLSSPSSPYTTSGVTAESLIDLVYKLRSGYRANAKFAMNTVTQGHVRKMQDTYGQYLWQPSFQMGQPDRLLGYPVFSWEDLGNPTSANAYPVIFGDFNKGYTLATRSGMSIVRENVTAPGFTNFYIARRYGGIVANNDALKILKVAVS